MHYPIEPLDPGTAFPQLTELPQAPQSLTMRGTLANVSGKKLIAVVGSRTCTSYGAALCRSLIEGLQGYPVVIVSGLAVGIDAIAHQTALDVGLPTIAFPGSGLSWNVLYPPINKVLAESILKSGGAIISEYPSHQYGARWTFPRRNRLMAGIADMTIIIEAEEKSGSLITARLATEYNRIVGAVPGPVTSSTSKGTNWLLKLGAVPITESADILRELGLLESIPGTGNTLLNSMESAVLQLLVRPLSKEEISSTLLIPLSQLSTTLSTLEIKGYITERLGLIYRTK